MKVLEVDSPGLKLKERQRPSPGEGEVLLEVAFCGICGSDVHSIEVGLYEDGLVPGHEFSGVVVELGPGVEDFAIGDRVVVDPVVGCGQCRFCREGRPQLCDSLETLGITSDGGMAEYAVVPASSLYKLDSISLKEAALLEPLSVAVHAAERAELADGEKVLIIGGGTVGLMLLQVARLKTEEVALVEPSHAKRQIGLKLGARWVTDPSTTCKLSRQIGPFDVVFEAVGKPDTLQNALDMVSKGGRVVVVGLHTEEANVDPLKMMYEEVSLLGTFANQGDFPEAIELLAEGRVKAEPLISRVFSLEQGPEAFRQLKTQPNWVKVLLKAGGGDE